MTKTRRAKGTGSVYPDRTKGVWVASLPATEGFNRQRKTFKTKQEADKAIIEMIMARSTLTVDQKTEITFGHLVNWYEDVYQAERLRSGEITAKSRITATNIVNRLKRCIPDSMPLSDINTLAYLDTLKHRLDRTGLARSTQNRTLKQLSVLLGLAVQRGWIEINQLKSIKKLPEPKRDAVILEPEQLALLMDDVKGSKYEAFYVLAAPYGMRAMEALGLVWDDIDWDSNTIYIRRQLSRIDGQPVRFERQKLKNKAEGEYRQVSLLPHQREFLLRYRNLYVSTKSSDKWLNGEGYNVIVSTKDGHPVDSSTVLQDLKRRATRLGLPSTVNLHSLRHSAASHLLAEGVPITAIQSLMGWSPGSRVLMALYAHMTRQGQDAAIAAATRLYGGTVLD